MGKIKYDMQELKLVKIIAIVMTVISITDIIIVTFFPEILDMCHEVLMAVISLGAMFFPISTVAMWLYELEIYCYLYRLKKHGYSVVERKKDYGQRLENVPRNASVKLEERNKGSLILSYIAFVGMSVPILFGMYLVKRYNIILGDMVFFLCVLLILCGMWLIFALQMRKQSNNKVYRDDVETDESKKVRMEFVRGIVSIAVYFVAMSYIFLMMKTMLDYVMQSG